MINFSPITNFIAQNLTWILLTMLSSIEVVWRTKILSVYYCEEKKIISERCGKYLIRVEKKLIKIVAKTIISLLFVKLFIQNWRIYKTTQISIIFNLTSAVLISRKERLKKVFSFYETLKFIPNHKTSIFIILLFHTFNLLFLIPNSNWKENKITKTI